MSLSSFDSPDRPARDRSPGGAEAPGDPDVVASVQELRDVAELLERALAHGSR